MASQIERLKKPSTSTVNKRKPETPGSNGKSLEVRGRNKVNAEADLAITAFVNATSLAGIEGLKREFADVKGYTSADMACTKFMENDAFSRNRYKGIQSSFYSPCKQSSRCRLFGFYASCVVIECASGKRLYSCELDQVGRR